MTGLKTGEKSSVARNLFQLQTGYYTAGIVFSSKTRTCTEAAPIVGWMVGKDFEWIKAYCKRKGIQIRRVECKTDGT
jgi:hypothetical protein